jgi:hypothetical protein
VLRVVRARMPQSAVEDEKMGTSARGAGARRQRRASSGNREELGGGRRRCVCGVKMGGNSSRVACYPFFLCSPVGQSSQENNRTGANTPELAPTFASTGVRWRDNSK